MLGEEASDIVLLLEVLLVDQVDVLLVLPRLCSALHPNLAEVVPFPPLKLQNSRSIPRGDRARSFGKDEGEN